MTTRRSAGLLLYRHTPEGPEILLGHMGGPYFAHREDGAWSIPKGEYDDTEDAFAAALREFREEFGSPAPTVDFRLLGSVRQQNGKIVTGWAAEADFDVAALTSNTFEIEWPPKSGRRQAFPEIDRAAWFGAEGARTKMITGQDALVDLLLELLRAD